ncbi:hypothetical protein, partial [Peribacillus frigoritolerans]|uniref:hypothetical protein n=1 Tax=Peribacillus castrilensis TaxID=2897690 RepID=UPI00296E5D26|nr:hypothetical protein [Peribacillus castrilensis]
HIAVLSFKVKSYNEYFLFGRKISHKKHPVNVSLVSNIYGAVHYSILWVYNLDVDFRFGHSLSAGGPGASSAPLRLRGLP